jgi:putative polyhydroxyalkanoate system protein
MRSARPERARRSSASPTRCARSTGACDWNGDVLSFSRAGVSGTLAVGESDVVLDAELGMLLSAFRSRIEEQLQKNFDHYFS